MVGEFLAIAVFGLVIGICSGLLGIGGGVIMVPSFRLIFGMDALACTGTSLFTIIPTSISGAITHLRNGTCIPKLGIALGIGGACTSPLGVWLASRSPEWLVMIAAAIVMAYSAFTMFRKALAKPAGARAAGAGAGAGNVVITATSVPDSDKPIKKTFLKWLFLIMVITYFIMLVFLYYLFSKQDQQNAAILLQEKTGDICRLVDNTDMNVSRKDLTIGKSGFVVIANDDKILATGMRALKADELSGLAIDYDQLPQDEVCDMIVDGVPGSGIIRKAKDYTVLSFVPDTEIYAGRDQTLSGLLGGMVVLFLTLFGLISGLVQRNVVQKIQDVNESLSEIRAGNLDEKVTVSGNTEFEELSLGINTTVDALKDTMREIAEKNHAELEFAREVQTTALPSGGLAGRGKFGFEILGSMQPAREVGGDFYDYFMIGEDKLGFVIADVSGKGIPAALFMMRATTLINNFVLEGKSPAEALQRSNVELCENNDKGMFVTVWLGILHMQTGELEFANAAHNPPVLKKNGEPFVYMDHKTYRRGLMLAGLPETQYRNNVITVDAGDMLFLYTDGVTEAANPKLELYGEQRLLECLEANYELEPAELIRAVRADIDAFAAGMEQYDDITMVVLKLT